jgi:hypothetical protein
MPTAKSTKTEGFAVGRQSHEPDFVTLRDGKWKRTSHRQVTWA